MKKIIVAAAFVGFVAFANAAAIDWSATAVCDPVASASAGKASPASGWLGYVIMASDLSAVTGGLDKGDTSTLLSKYVGPQKATTSKGAFQTSEASGNIAEGNQDFYLIVLNSTTTAAATGYFVSQKVTENIPADLPAVLQFQSLKDGTMDAAGWSTMSSSAAPEPTSGLLLLLGMAGLALKRKRT